MCIVRGLMSRRRKTAHGVSPSNTEDRLIEIDEVLQLVPASRYTIYRWRRAGIFPHPIVVGVRRYWSTRDIADWIEQQRARRDEQHEAAARR